MNDNQEQICRKDPRFGTQGKVEIQFPGIETSGAYALVSPSAEQLVVAARIGVAGRHQVALAGLCANGELDRDYGQDGFVMAPLGVGYAAVPVALIALRGSGACVLLAEDRTADVGCPVLARIGRDGHIDHDFGEGGKAVIRLPGASGNDEPYGVIELPDGKLMIAATRFDENADPSGLLIRLHADGKLDTGFQGCGYRLLTLAGEPQIWIEGLMLQADGKLVVWGATDDDGLFARLYADGCLDERFGTGGFVLVGGEDAGSRWRGLELYHVIETATGSLLGFGATNDRPYQSAVIGLTGRGCPDQAFNEGRALFVPVSSHGSRWIWGDVQDNGTIAASGLTGVPYAGDETRFLVGRFLPEGKLDPSFGCGTGLKMTNVDEGPDITRCSVLQSGRRLVLGGTSDNPGPVEKTYLVRYFI
ncbi:hypothetical protein [Pseudomonas fluorescens]|uniref:Delta-60 repeat protein n=1 Tax=Pseudomonas fluorescens TaxID=294 RepID=A0A5E7FCT6_PSEFL|nr:hypothetical protein [Pseudomonas fluorescens]VVO36744.1 hypothetical protein PS710_05481 [Pseudomonas fluorescens]